jgi:hypothetical protein
MATINFRVDDDLKIRLVGEAYEQGFQSLSDYMQALVDGRHKRASSLGKGKKKINKPEGDSFVLRTRVNAEEKAAFDFIREQENVSESFLLLRQVRALITTGAHFSAPELQELRHSNQQLIAIGRNLNQIVTLINSGEITDSHLSQRYMEQLKEYIDRSVKAIGALVEKNRKRGL